MSDSANECHPIDNLLESRLYIETQRIIFMPTGKEPRRTVQSVINDLIGRVNTDTRRLRIIEQETNIFKSRMAAIEQNSADQRKAINASVAEMAAKVARAEDKDGIPYLGSREEHETLFACF